MISNRPLPWRGIEKARFVERPNRFLVRCRAASGKIINAHMPNSGHLWELLIPGAVVYLVPSRPGQAAPPEGAKTSHTAIAIDAAGVPVFIHTHAANSVAAWLLRKQWVPRLEGAEVVRAENPVGRSRFDFLMRRDGREFLLEVKTVTLFGNRVAQFPDAISERGTRHLQELAELSRPKEPSTVLFLVQYDGVDWFLPDYHTDLVFAQALLAARLHLRVLPVAIGWNERFEIRQKPKLLEIPWQHLQRECADRGAYLLVLHLDEPQSLTIGSIGTHTFAAGYYVYVGSAMANLSARIARHLRKRKKMHWHIDHLREHAGRCVALPIRSSRREECIIAQACGGVLEPGPTGFGSSDCACGTHLFYSAQNPLHCPAFYELLFRFRMAAPR